MCLFQLNTSAQGIGFLKSSKHKVKTFEDIQSSCNDTYLITNWLASKVIIHKSKPSTALLYKVAYTPTWHNTYWSLQLGPEVITFSLKVSRIRHGLGKGKKTLAIKNNLHSKERRHLFVLVIHKLHTLFTMQSSKYSFLTTQTFLSLLSPGMVCCWSELEGLPTELTLYLKEKRSEPILVRVVDMSTNNGRTQSTLLAKTYGRLIFKHFLPHFGQIVDKNFRRCKFTPKIHNLHWNNTCENDRFTATSRSWRYTEEKITQDLLSLKVSQAVSRLAFALQRKLRALQLLENFTLHSKYFCNIVRNFGLVMYVKLFEL